MTQVTTSIDIDRSPEEVFAFLTDLDNAPLWTVGLIEVRHSGPLHLGARGVDVRTVAKKPTEMPWEVIGYDPPRSLALSYSEPFPATATFTIDSITGGTRLTCDTTLQLKGAYRLMAPMITKEARATDKEQFLRAKTVLEGRKP